MFTQQVDQKYKTYLLFGVLGFIILVLIVAIFLITQTKQTTPPYDEGEEETIAYRDNLRASDPAFSILPYDSNPGRTNGFRIFAIPPDNNSKIVLSITVRTCNQPIRTDLQQDALDWLESKGLDLNNYLVKYDTTCD